MRSPLQTLPVARDTQASMRTSQLLHDHDSRVIGKLAVGTKQVILCSVAVAQPNIR